VLLLLLPPLLHGWTLGYASAMQWLVESLATSVACGDAPLVDAAILIVCM
jgi:hypothetical protein